MMFFTRYLNTFLVTIITLNPRDNRVYQGVHPHYSCLSPMFISTPCMQYGDTSLSDAVKKERPYPVIHLLFEHMADDNYTNKVC